MLWWFANATGVFATRVLERERFDTAEVRVTDDELCMLLEERDSLYQLKELEGGTAESISQEQFCGGGYYRYLFKIPILSVL